VTQKSFLAACPEWAESIPSVSFAGARFRAPEGNYHPFFAHSQHDVDRSKGWGNQILHEFIDYLRKTSGGENGG
jgi:hypothetical protein